MPEPARLAAAAPASAEVSCARTKRIAPGPWLDALHQHLEGVRRGGDIEDVHQLRVAAGRLDVWLGLGGYALLRDDLRWLRRAAGPTRDLDVLLLSAPPEPLQEWLLACYGETRRRLIASLDHARVEGALAALAGLPAVSWKSAHRAVARQRERTLKAGRAAVQHTRDEEAVHRLRRALRRLRYGMEWLGASADPLKDVQEAMGQFHDVVVACRCLETCPRRAELGEYEAELRRLRRRRHVQSLAAWRKLLRRWKET